jgi:8-oxo-dGTP pyrophosphatase MutT (NUDIX family)
MPFSEFPHSAGRQIPFDSALRARIEANLAGFERLDQPAAGLKGAAVAITVLDDGAGNAAFLLTRRSSRLRSHAGQWALPGGRLDGDEDAVAGALRELEEEVGLSPGSENVLGVLDDYPTRSGYLITPVVVWIEEANFDLNADEVMRVYPIPLAELMREDSPEFVDIPESDRPVLRLPLAERRLNAPSGAYLYQFREVALQGRTIRVAHYEQPVFAWD